MSCNMQRHYKTRYLFLDIALWRKRFSYNLRWNSQLLYTLLPHALRVYSNVRHQNEVCDVCVVPVVLLYKCLLDMAAQYLQTYCEPTSTVASQHLWSTHSGRLTVPRTRTNYGDRSFPVQGPRVWNSVPAALRAPDITLTTFRNKLKTFLFNCSYSAFAAFYWLCAI